MNAVIGKDQVEPGIAGSFAGAAGLSQLQEVHLTDIEINQQWIG
jgi:hypothetical protein